MSPTIAKYLENRLFSVSFFKVRIFIVWQPGSPIPIYTEGLKYIGVVVRVQFNKSSSFYEAPFYYLFCIYWYKNIHFLITEKIHLIHFFIPKMDLKLNPISCYQFFFRFFLSQN